MIHSTISYNRSPLVRTRHGVLNHTYRKTNHNTLHFVQLSPVTCQSLKDFLVAKICTQKKIAWRLTAATITRLWETTQNVIFQEQVSFGIKVDYLHVFHSSSTFLHCIYDFLLFQSSFPILSRLRRFVLYAFLTFSYGFSCLT